MRAAGKDEAVQNHPHRGGTGDVDFVKALILQFQILTDGYTPEYPPMKKP